MSYVVVAASNIGGNEGGHVVRMGRTSRAQDAQRTKEGRRGEREREGGQTVGRWPEEREREREREREGGKKNHDPRPSTSKKVLLEVTCCAGDGDDDAARPWEVR